MAGAASILQISQPLLQNFRGDLKQISFLENLDVLEDLNFFRDFYILEDGSLEKIFL